MSAEPVFEVPHLQLRGGAEEIGHAHGAALAGRLRAFLDDGRARLDRIAAEPLGDLGPTCDAYLAAITRESPHLAAEIAGLARGAGIPLRDAVLLQIRRELMGYRRVPTRGDCTAYARSGPAPVLAQTVDLNGDLDDQIAVLDVAGPDAPRRSLLLSFGGLLGYLGLNDAGLAVGLNLVLSGTWRAGLPPYLAIRHLLDTASSVDEAVAVLGDLDLASSRSLLLCDASTTAVVELPDSGPGRHGRVRTAAEQVHTNHYLDPALTAGDALNVFARNSSQRRLDACRQRLLDIPATASAEDHFEVLSEAPVNVAGMGDIRMDRTVATVVLLPGSGELHLRPGDPARSATRVYALGGTG